MAITADSRLQEVVTKLCTVRRSKYGRDKIGNKPGSISELLTMKYEGDKEKSYQRWLAKEEEDKAAMAKKHLNKSIKFNISVEEPLAKTAADLHLHLN